MSNPLINWARDNIVSCGMILISLGMATFFAIDVGMGYKEARDTAWKLANLKEKEEKERVKQRELAGKPTRWLCSPNEIRVTMSDGRFGCVVGHPAEEVVDPSDDTRDH